MPLITITIKGAELEKPTTILLERPMIFTKLKLAHIYHNIDSINFTKENGDSAQQANLFIRLGGLVDNHKQIINYEGNYTTSISHNINAVYDGADFQ